MATSSARRKNVLVRVTDSELRWWKTAARQCGQTLSEWVRQAAREHRQKIAEARR